MANLLCFAQHHQFSIDRFDFWPIFTGAIQEWQRFLDTTFFDPKGGGMAMAFLSWIFQNLCLG